MNDILISYRNNDKLLITHLLNTLIKKCGNKKTARLIIPTMLTKNNLKLEFIPGELMKALNSDYYIEETGSVQNLIFAENEFHKIENKPFLIYNIINDSLGLYSRITKNFLIKNIFENA